MGQHVQRSGDDVSASGPLVTQADRFRWQSTAVRELVAILDAHPGLQAITWTIGPGGAITGRINGLTGSAAEVRATFLTWRDAIGLNERAEQSADDGPVIHLRASGRHGTVSVRITANVFTDEPTADVASIAVTPGPRGAARAAQVHDRPPLRPRLPQGPQPSRTL